MTDLGNMGGLDSWATAVSANGLVIAGYVQTRSPYRYVAFTYSNGKVTRFREEANSQPAAVSADGSVVVGWTETGVNNVLHKAPFVFSKGTVTVLDTEHLDTPYQGQNSFGTGVSADGSVVVGYVEAGHIGSNPAFVYTEGTVTLLPLSDAHAYGVSADGQAMVGRIADSASHPKRAGFLFQ
jgi:probable HAF family extracellular repeat protein